MKKKFPEDLVTNSKRRALQYQHVDGTFELNFGGAMLLMAGCLFILNKFAISNDLLLFAPLVVFVGGIYLIDDLVQRFRLRVTYLRTGYIAYQKPRPTKRSTRMMIWFGIPFITLTLLVLIFLNRSKVPMASQDYVLILFPSFAGLLFTGLWMVVAWKTSLPRFYLTAAVALLVSVWIFINGIADKTGMSLLFGLMGVDLCIAGSLTLRQYLHKNPVTQKASDEQ
jgi:hypothetical protein